MTGEIFIGDLVRCQNVPGFIGEVSAVAPEEHHVFFRAKNITVICGAEDVELLHHREEYNEGK